VPHSIVAPSKMRRDKIERFVCISEMPWRV
jgi:hypothetical protein